MSHKVRSKAQRQVEEFLRSLPFPWQIVNGGKHKHVILDGRMIGVIQSGGQSCRDGDNIIRRAEKYIRENTP